eukprot:Seg5856.2 transcript_id=Seg5856.2/GoldUCD/mRNA.D3Y31 product="Golgi-associated plant pathogenesis-related protein 1" protein_id=Seg5856.2/GoldUCD/D3Y31
MIEFCPIFKEKGYCESRVVAMEKICSETCEYCPKEPFSKDIGDIINDFRKVEIAAGKDISTIKEDLEEGKGSPTAGGNFGGNGESEAEQEATDVGGESEETVKEEDTMEDGNEGETDGGDAAEGQVVGAVGATDGCDKQCQTECVQAHNKYRANHGAPALKWDKTLADQAQAVANKNAADNQFKHSDWAAGKGGECIAWGPVKPSWLIAVKDWHDEEKNYDWNTGKSSNGKAIGHFTQVVWKKATKVGCGKSEMTLDGSKGPFYIAQMDVVGIVQKNEELGLVGRPKQPDMDWFKGKKLTARRTSKKNTIGERRKSHTNSKHHRKYQ